MITDCPKCWEHFCTCGYQYKDWKIKRKLELIFGILNVHDDNIKNEIKKFLSDLEIIEVKSNEK